MGNIAPVKVEWENSLNVRSEKGKMEFQNRRYKMKLHYLEERRQKRSYPGPENERSLEQVLMMTELSIDQCIKNSTK